MARRKISQVEAWSLYHQVIALEKVLEAQRSTWNSDWPQGKLLASRTYAVDTNLVTAVKVARLLGHAVVVNSVNSDELRYYALPLGGK